MRFIIFFILTIYLFGVDAELTIEKDVNAKASIAIIEDRTTANGSNNHNSMFSLLQNDIKLSGHFNLDENKREGSFDDNSIPPELNNIEYILKYRFSSSENALDIKLLKVNDSSIVFERGYSINNSKRYPFLAHNAIVDINSALNHDNISWMKRYLIFSKYIGSRKSEIWIADYTLTFASVIVRGGLNIFPKWADDAQSAFYYTSYNNKIPTLYRVDMRTGDRKKIISSQGMLVCSDVSPDNSRILLTMAPKGQPDIYEYELGGGVKQITKFAGIDVNGKYLGDGSRIVFVSDRMGKPNIYLKSIDSSSVSKVGIYGNNNSSCDAFSEYILYSVKEGKSINIYLGSAYSSYTRPLTSNGINIFPRFSIDGKIVLYIKQNGGKNSIGYLNLATKESALYPLKIGQIQSIDW